MKRFVGLFVVVVFAISTSMVYGAPLKNEIVLFGKGGVVFEEDEKGKTVIRICPEQSSIQCATIRPCPNGGGGGGGNGGDGYPGPPIDYPYAGYPCKVEMQDGSGKVYEGILLEIGENNQGAKIDPSTQCPE